MNARPLLAALALACAAPGAAAADPKPAATPAAPRPAAPPTVAPGSFEAFRIVSERNIFNPNRVGRSRGGDAPPPRTDAIAFVGTMQYEKGLFAFFDGSDSAYRKTLQVGGTVGLYRVARITPDSVELSRDNQSIALRVSDQLRRPEGGDWALVAGDAVRNEASAAQAAASAPDSNAALPIPAGASDTLKRLMEQRQKQLKP